MTAQWSVEQGVTPKPRLLDLVRNRFRAKLYSRRTEQSYTHWIKRFILFHGKRHPNDMGAKEVEAFLSSLAVDRNVSASTQRQALAAILFFKTKMGSVTT
ncbi:MAG: phage integrase N-terminal SAM-like domain-containing protein [Hydrogenophilales bacterium]|nr:phage integrase N-terminal SAM-like domain-containing protein [Hydrogenophilales bacterium]